MLTIIEDAIDYAALEGGALALAHAPFDLAAVIDAAVQIDAARAHEKGLDLAAVIDPALPALVVGDAARVRLIVRKLLSNAITFTDTGSVLVRAAAAAGGGVRIEFEDTGVGVRAGTTPDLFEAFVQGDTSTTRRHGGTGPRAGHRPPPDRGDGRHHRRRRPGRRRLAVLGRAAARVRRRRSGAGPAPAPAFAGRRAVVLCTARATRHAAEGELRAAGFEVAVADTAAGGLDRLTANRGTDLLVLDLRVHDLDVLAMRLASAALEHGAAEPCWCWRRPRSGRRCRRCSRPARPGCPARCCAGRCARRSTGCSGPTASREPFDPLEALGSLRILAADDYPANLRIVTRVLEKRGHTVETVTTGAAAAAAVLASHYDLVLMDCRMPEMDGYDATALIRAREGGRRRTPIIALTANDSDDDRQRCVDVGMDAFVAKPLRPAELFAAIEQVLTSPPAVPARERAPAPRTRPSPERGPSGSGDRWHDLRETLAAWRAAPSRRWRTSTTPAPAASAPSSRRPRAPPTSPTGCVRPRVGGTDATSCPSPPDAGDGARRGREPPAGENRLPLAHRQGASMSNLRLALRMLFRTPALTAIAILSLAIGIGANAAIFSLYNQMLMRPLPVADPDGLVNLGAPGPKHGSQSSNNAGSQEYTFSYPMFRDLEKAKTRFSGIAAHRQLETNLAFQGQTTAGLGMLVSGSYFGVLGLTPAAGRLIGPEDDRTPGAHQVAVLSHGYWRTRFAMSPAIIGSTIVVNAVPMTIIGVAPEGFTGTTIDRAAADLRPDLDARAPRRRVQGPRQAAQLLGLPLRPAAAGRDDRAGQGRRRRALCRHRQRRRGRAAERT